MSTPALTWAVIGTVAVLMVLAVTGTRLPRPVWAAGIVLAALGTALVLGQLAALPATAPEQLQLEQAR